MNSKDFILRIMGLASTADLLNLLIETLEEVDLKDEDGDSVTRKSPIAGIDLQARPQSDVPRVRISISLEELTIKSQGVTITIPAKSACEFLNAMEEVHETWHESLTKTVLVLQQELMTDNEKVLQESILNNLFHKN